MIETVKDLIEALGGTGKVASLLGIVPSAVSNWIAAEEIPRGHHLDIYLECQRRNLPMREIMKVLGYPKDHPFLTHVSHQGEAVSAA
jgi:predicted transcriptional regulator